LYTTIIPHILHCYCIPHVLFLVGSAIHGLTFPLFCIATCTGRVPQTILPPSSFHTMQLPTGHPYFCLLCLPRGAFLIHTLSPPLPHLPLARGPLPILSCLTYPPVSYFPRTTDAPWTDSKHRRYHHTPPSTHTYTHTHTLAVSGVVLLHIHVFLWTIALDKITLHTTPNNL